MIEISQKEYHKILNWNDGTLYCFSLSIDGKAGWRLPTITELTWMFEQNLCEYSYYMSSELIDDDGVYALYVHDVIVRDGYCVAVQHDINAVHHVVPVRIISN